MTDRWSPATRAYAALQHAGRTAPDPRTATLRVGDADRQRVVAELQRHYVEGRLTSDELGERVDQALAARTVADLAVPMHDLPSAEPEAKAVPARQASWWTPFTTLPGMVLLGVLAVMLLTWLIWLPSAHLGIGGVPTWPVVFLGGFFFFGRPGRRGRR